MTNTALNATKVGDAWMSFRAASRFLFWSVVEAITAAIWWRKQAARELAALHPENPRDLWDAGYAIFCYELMWDDWRGSWLGPEDRNKVAYPMYCVRDWDSVPWHRVKFSEMKHDGREFRAVPKGFAEKYLKDGVL